MVGVNWVESVQAVSECARQEGMGAPPMVKRKRADRWLAASGVFN